MVLQGLLAATAFAIAQAGIQVPEAAENFVQTCVATGGERSAVAELARTQGWLPVETAPREGVVWADAYRAGDSVVALYLSPATDAPSDAGPGIPVILSPPKSHCLVALQAPAGAWRLAATVLDASDRLAPFPDVLQPAEGAGRNGAVRYYGLTDRMAVVTLREDTARGLLEISIVRGLLRDTED